MNREAALEILTRDCFFRLGTCIAPKGIAKEGDEVMRVRMRRSDGTEVEKRTMFGDLMTLPFEMGGFAEVEIQPARGFDVGNGRGKRLKTRVIGGAMGLIIDTRGRPIFVVKTKQRLVEWIKALDAYPSILGDQGSGGD